MKLMILIGLMTGAAATYGAEASKPAEDCKVEFSGPKPGSSVGETDSATGTARIPAGKYLWIFAHRKGLALFWPQGGGAASVSDNKWDVLATFGEPRDSGAQFEIVAVVVDVKVNEELSLWVSRAESSGRYPGIRLPSPVLGCNVPRVVVTRNN